MAYVSISPNNSSDSLDGVNTQWLASRFDNQKFDNCPDCGDGLKETDDTRERITEDIPQNLKPVITKDVIHRDWCSASKKRVEPKPPDFLPRCQIDNRALVLSN